MQDTDTRFKVTQQDNGSVLLEHVGSDSFTLSSDEAYALLDFLYKMRDSLATAVHGQETGYVIHDFERADEAVESQNAVVDNQFPVVPPSGSSERIVVENQAPVREQTIQAADE